MSKAQELRRQMGGGQDYASQMRAQGINPADPDGSIRLGIRGNTSVADADAALPGLKAKLADIDASKAADVSNSSAFLKQAQDQVKLNQLVQAKVDAGEIAAKVADVATEAPKGAAMTSDYLQKVISGEHPRPMISADAAQKALDWQAANPEAAKALTKTATDAAGGAAKGFSKEYLEKVISGQAGRPMISVDKAKALLQNMESIEHAGHRLSEGQVYLVFKQVCTTNDTFIAEGKLLEGPLDAIKGLAGKAMDKARTVGTNLTTKVTADKLNSAWQKAGSPTDSEELKKFLTSQGVDAGVVDTVYKTLKIKATGATSLYAQVKTDLAKVDKKGKQRLMAYLQKQLGTA
jgi:hypothetical protein